MKAIVFDNAGTIIKRVTALKDMHLNKLIYESNTIDIVNQNDESLILIFQTPTKELIKSDVKIIDYLMHNEDSYEIGYSTNKYSKSDIINALRNDETKLSHLKESAFGLVDKYDIEICSGSALIVNIREQKIDYTYTAGGIFFEDTSKLFKSLRELGYAIYIASGDNKQSLSKIADNLKIPISNVFDTCNINCKRKVVEKLQDEYEKVIMVGNNTNDYMAIRQADIGILTMQQKENLPDYLKESADYIITDIRQVLKIVEKEV
ncbi:MAG: hypothetical protein BZ138_02280 [Methanosphaera sp. rholeuAM270]|nr:MAG: hypothetical protein BZ138_02280 [Methanosphaera sp. rholeuAM270]